MTTDSSAIFAKLFVGPLRKGERTKLRIIETAIDLVGREGIEALTFEAVGKPIGLNRAQVRYHFPEKEELVSKLFDYVFLTMQPHLIDRLAAAKNWKERVLALNEGLFDFVAAHPMVARLWVYFHTAAAANARFRDLMQRAEVTGQARVVAILDEVRAEKGWSKALVATLARGIWAVVDAFAIYEVSLQPEDATLHRREARRILLRLIEEDGR